MTADQAAAQLQAATASLRVIGAGLLAAAQRGDTAAVATYRSQYLQLMRYATALRAQVSEADQPGTFLRVLSDFSDTALGIAAEVGKISSTLGEGLAANVPKVIGALPTVLVVGLVAAAVLGIAYLKHKWGR